MLVRPSFSPAALTLGAFSAFLAALLWIGFSGPAEAGKGKKPKPGSSGHHGVTTYEGSATCKQCHSNQVQEVLNSEHYKWAGKLGKINDFCTYPDINWLQQLTVTAPDGTTKNTVTGCASCHVSYGDFTPPAVGGTMPVQEDKIDCLVCHSDAYKRVGTLVNGKPALVMDPSLNPATVLAAIKKTPSAQACLNCHARAGGGNAIKQGDLELAMANPPFDLDVHLAGSAVGGAGLTCVSCHTVSAHKIAGKGNDLRVAEGSGLKTCITCHGTAPHGSGNLNKHYSRDKQPLDCTVCHIPSYARGLATEIRRDFSVPAEFDLAVGRWEPHRTLGEDLLPVWRTWNGTSFFYNLGTAISGDTLTLAGPNAGTRLYPFKVHTARMAVDQANRLIPLKSAPLWSSGDLNLARVQGELEVFGNNLTSVRFVEATRYFGLYHQVAPKDQAKQVCARCHK